MICKLNWHFKQISTPLLALPIPLPFPFITHCTASKMVYDPKLWDITVFSNWLANEPARLFGHTSQVLVSSNVCRLHDQNLCWLASACNCLFCQKGLQELTLWVDYLDKSKSAFFLFTILEWEWRPECEMHAFFYSAFIFRNGQNAAPSILLPGAEWTECGEFIL